MRLGKHWATQLPGGWNLSAASTANVIESTVNLRHIETRATCERQLTWSGSLHPLLGSCWFRVADVHAETRCVVCHGIP